MSKIIGTITNSLLFNEDKITDPKNQLSFFVFNNGFNGEKFESIIGFKCIDDSIDRYEDISLDLFLGEVEIVRLIKKLKKHLKDNRIEKKMDPKKR